VGVVVNESFLEKRGGGVGNAESGCDRKQKKSQSVIE